MKISMRPLAQLERGYSIALLRSGAGRMPSVLAGSEGEGPLLFLEAPDFQPRVVGQEPGGFISICPLRWGGRDWVVASTEFKPGFNATTSAVRVFPLDGSCDEPFGKVVDLPFIHRIALQEIGGRQCLLLSTLCSGKKDRDDWSQPGGVHLAEIPPTPAGAWRVRQVVKGLNKNHGMDFAVIDGAREGYLLSAAEGLLFAGLPGGVEDPWRTEQIHGEETSDAVAFDWDGDGRSEVFSISPFHGNVLSLHRRSATGWQRATITEDLAFGHIVWAGTLGRRPALLAGSRRERRELRLYRSDANGGVDPAWQLIDEGIGPAQMCVDVVDERHARLFVTAHGCNEVRLYELSE